MSKPDYVGYEQALETIREEALQDYWAHLVNLNQHQVNVGRTYLWVSVALVGAYAAVFDRYHETIANNCALIALSSVSFILAAIAFGVCLYAIPARKGYRAIPTKGWGEFSQNAYDLLKDNKPSLYATFLTSHIADIDHARSRGFKTNRSRARLLRFTSWFLIVSFVVALACGVVGIWQSSMPKEEQSMSNENGESNGGLPESDDPKLNVPKPPPPADVDGPDITTHGKKPGRTTTFITEGVDKKRGE